MFSRSLLLTLAIILRKWEPSLQNLSFDLSSLPIWVHLYNVPLELFSRLGLSYIGSAIGIPLSMDTVTASKTCLEYTKLCIEIRAKDTIPEQVKVELKDGVKVPIMVKVPWMPARCNFCKIFGHNDKGCTQSKNHDATKTQYWRKKEKSSCADSDPTVGGIETLQENPSLSSDKSKEVTSTVVEHLKGRKEQYDDQQDHSVSAVNGSQAIANDQNKENTEQFKIPQDNIDSNVETSKIICEASSIIPTKGRGRSPKEKLKTDISASTNRFQILNDSEDFPAAFVEIQKKPRAASKGVVALVKELKSKKKEKQEKSKCAEGSGGGDKPVTPPQ
ncbi:uncharacterized protein LOC120203531 [Hibiscus syriacus]|uniref:uncharacterized protein LOC120203531 n=1 Tax=Hibiscus syriacus TaxID=106335 RepID=UPI0019235209|nr:uncharacterized protein LOC120203531 [Hibiscus syriacus]